jgi:hypothetical protein
MGATCQGCGVGFEPTHGHQQYCDKGCQKRANNKRSGRRRTERKGSRPRVRREAPPDRPKPARRQKIALRADWKDWRLRLIKERHGLLKAAGRVT